MGLAGGGRPRQGGPEFLLGALRQPFEIGRRQAFEHDDLRPA
jgi:hypothetical protein